MIINFTKMHSLGNDFIIIDAITQNIKLNSAYIKKISDRKTGVGCDQVIIIEPPMDPSADFYYKIYNSDGKNAEQCLNGARCAARLALDSGIIKETSPIAESPAGKISLNIIDSQIVTANLGIIKPDINKLLWQSSILNDKCTIYHLSIGNHHAILIINDLINQCKKTPLAEKIIDLHDNIYNLLAEELANDKNLFPQGVNIGFARLLDNNKMTLRVFERGVGETLACGSNSVAAFLIAKNLNLVDNKLDIMFKLGSLNLELIHEELIIKGPVNSVFCGKFKV